MSARLGLVAAFALAGCAPGPAPATAAPAPNGKALAMACEGRDGWSDPAPPARIHGNTYYVGTCGIAVLLIATPDGLVLLDGATEKAVPSILANIRTLGFDPKNVRYLLASHEHDDHVGGLATLQAATGARLLARREAVAALTSGTPDATDPQREIASPFAGVAVSRTVVDGEVVGLRDIALTAHATPGHTPGSTSWTWRSCEGGDCRTIAYVDSLTAISGDAYRFADHSDYVATFRATLAKVPTLPCDLLITPHPSASNLFTRLAGDARLVDADACHFYAAGAVKRLDERLAKENEAK